MKSAASSCELIGDANQLPRDASVRCIVRRVVHDHKLGARPHPVEIPRPSDRSLQVKPTIDHNPRNVGEITDVAQDASIIEPRIVPDVVGHDARKGQRKSRIVVPRRQLVDRRPRERRRFPSAPFRRGVMANCGIAVVQQSMVGLDDIAITFGRRQRVGAAIAREHHEAPRNHQSNSLGLS